jgi:hypothetical protein
MDCAQQIIVGFAYQLPQLSLLMRRFGIADLALACNIPPERVDSSLLPGFARAEPARFYLHPIAHKAGAISCD